MDDSVGELDELRTREDRRVFLLDLICFAQSAACQRAGQWHNWVFRDESMHMAFAFDVVDTVRQEEPGLWDDEPAARVSDMLAEALECEYEFAEGLLGGGVSGMSLTDMRAYLEYVADRRPEVLGIAPRYGSKNPFAFMELQDVQELSNFLERRVSAYRVEVGGSVSFDDTDI